MAKSPPRIGDDQIEDWQRQMRDARGGKPPKKTLASLRRIKAGNPRDEGRARMERKFKHVIEAMRLTGALRPGFVRDNETAGMRMHLDNIAEIISMNINDDEAAGLLMRTIGYALDRMFGLGRIDGKHEPESELRHRHENSQDTRADNGCREQGRRRRAAPRHEGSVARTAGQFQRA